MTEERRPGLGALICEETAQRIRMEIEQCLEAYGKVPKRVADKLRECAIRDSLFSTHGHKPRGQ